MKRFVYVLAIVLLLGACKRTETQTEAKSPYPNIVVGVVANGDYSLENADVVKSEWKDKFNSTIESLKIVHAQSTDGAHAWFYMLEAKAKNGTHLATLLKEDNGKLLFDDNAVITSCRSQTGEIFNIKGISQEGHIRLYCSDCVECEKTESAL